MSENPPEEQKKKTITEELEVAGNQLVDRVQDIIRQGNVRRLIIRNADDKVLFETSLTLGVGLGGALALVGGLPLAVIATIAAAVSRVKVEIVREVDDDTEAPAATEEKKPSKRRKVEIDVDEE